MFTGITETWYGATAKGHIIPFSSLCCSIIDARNERAGVKFKDSEIMGIPMRVTVGKKITENNVEFKLRSADDNEVINIKQVVARVKEEFENNGLKIK